MKMNLNMTINNQSLDGVNLHVQWMEHNVFLSGNNISKTKSEMSFENYCNRKKFKMHMNRT